MLHLKQLIGSSGAAEFVVANETGTAVCPVSVRVGISGCMKLAGAREVRQS